MHMPLYYYYYYYYYNNSNNNTRPYLSLVPSPTHHTDTEMRPRQLVHSPTSLYPMMLK